MFTYTYTLFFVHISVSWVTWWRCWLHGVIATFDNQHLKRDYSVTPENFLCQILCACLAEFCPLMCCFCLKLLYLYKIGVMLNFNFKFCNYISLFVMLCCILHYALLLPSLLNNCKLISVKNWYVNILKCVDRQRSTKQLRALNAWQSCINKYKMLGLDATFVSDRWTLTQIV